MLQLISREQSRLIVGLSGARWLQVIGSCSEEREREKGKGVVVKLYAFAVSAVSGVLISAGAFGGVVDVITNGSFESPVVTGAFQQFPSGIPGWTGSAGIELQTNGALGAGQGTAFGNQYAELAVESPSTYSQTLTTTPGSQYDLSFYLSARPGTGSNSVTVGFSGSPGVTFTAADSGSVNFQHFTQSFTATTAQTILSFAPINLSDPGGGDLLDNVSLTTTSTGTPPSAVPVPAAVWTGLTGLLGLTSVSLCRQILRRTGKRS